ncbi:MAG: Fe-S cluster assembly ATPase SufC [Gammaproteobacteria bacterium]|nr:Fe-S cluster assembly ATPase SufC [Gammaproteobacteria bacterium]MCP4091153.1 Fe-S cluster assembly ATPase SufC [Gammaproteobacteria bacterium]MCP4277321.1 Fe-S cluster assembly ATPase SufC [Gammaproteobacteria bacterium]MCP4831618.1 Fe-S cluster assembly ATPase SufC [Gammaproteobacteria bacterium]MCP4927841.1 Fe-S cluster assembly ATPase SufC [Gammaproteobacteria bacterium]
MLIKINNLHVSVNETEIIKGLNLTIGEGEVHAIMGPNGSGKSTLAQTLAGHPNYDVTAGTVEFAGQNLLDLAADERARAGIFLGFQYPVEISGVSNIYMLKAALNARRKAAGKPEIDAVEFMRFVKEKAALMKLDQKFLTRGVNEGFSGGEKKRNEIFQMAVLEPKFAILDETDSGLDIDALKVVANGVNQQRDDKCSVLLITHYQRLLDYIQPDFVHVLANGQIIRSGDKDLALELEANGYDEILAAAKA